MGNSRALGAGRGESDFLREICGKVVRGRHSTRDLLAGVKKATFCETCGQAVRWRLSAGDLLHDGRHRSLFGSKRDIHRGRKKGRLREERMKKRRKREKGERKRKKGSNLCKE